MQNINESGENFRVSKDPVGDAFDSYRIDASLSGNKSHPGASDDLMTSRGFQPGDAVLNPAAYNKEFVSSPLLHSVSVLRPFDLHAEKPESFIPDDWHYPPLPEKKREEQPSVQAAPRDDTFTVRPPLPHAFGETPLKGPVRSTEERGDYVETGADGSQRRTMFNERGQAEEIQITGTTRDGHPYLHCSKYASGEKLTDGLTIVDGANSNLTAYSTEFHSGGQKYLETRKDFKNGEETSELNVVYNDQEDVSFTRATTYGDHSVYELISGGQGSKLRESWETLDDNKNTIKAHGVNYDGVGSEVGTYYLERDSQGRDKVSYREDKLPDGQWSYTLTQRHADGTETMFLESPRYSQAITALPDGRRGAITKDKQLGIITRRGFDRIDGQIDVVQQDI